MVYAPWEDLGAATFGYSEAEAVHNIKEVLAMILEEVIRGELSWDKIAARGGLPLADDPLVLASDDNIKIIGVPVDIDW